MSGYYKFVNTKNPSTDWTSEIVLARDKEGEPSTVLVKGGKQEQLSDEQYESLKDSFDLEKQDGPAKEEANPEESSSAGSDTAQSGPVFGVKNVQKSGQAQ